MLTTAARPVNNMETEKSVDAVRDVGAVINKHVKGFCFRRYNFYHLLRNAQVLSVEDGCCFLFCSFGVVSVVS